MKNQINVLVAAVLLITALFTAAATAENPMIVRIDKGEAARTLTVQLANLQQQYTALVVQDITGKYWYSESIWNEEGYAKLLNLNGMPNGYYLCYVKNRSGLYTQSFRLDETDLVLFEHPESENSGAAFTFQTGSERPSIVRIKAGEGSQVRLQLANLQEQPTLVQLNTLGESIAYRQSIRGEQAFAQNINLGGMASGAYFLYVSVGQASLVQFIELSPSGVQLGALDLLEQVPVKRAGLASN